jgi:hypothetical protein
MNLPLECYHRETKLLFAALPWLLVVACSTSPSTPDATPPDATPPDAAGPVDSAPLSLDSLAGDSPVAPGKTYYIRPLGGTKDQCDGLSNQDLNAAAAPGLKNCALNHPFQLLPPTGSALLSGGDTMIIAKGSYRMGIGAPGSESCDSLSAYDCHLPAIPSGSANNPTRILGEGWSSGCPHAPSLWGAERPWQVIDLTGSNFVTIECLEITDHASCVESHSNALHTCQRSSAPYGDWASIGIFAAKSKEVVLRNLNIHGLAHSGIHAGQLANWTLENVRIAGNGWVGWDGDIDASHQSSANSGEMVFKEVTIEWNGCGETYPEETPTGCWGQSAGGYGDGLGTAETGGNWTFEDCNILHNTSDGLDLLYHSLGGTVTVRRIHSEGNGGNPLKSAGNTRIVNSLLVGNCAFFEGKAFTDNVDHCRALGNTLEASFTTGSSYELINSTLYGQGDVLVSMDIREGHTCDGSETFVALNNIFIGNTDYHQPFEKTALHYAQGCAGLVFNADYGVIHNVKGTCAVGSNDICADPIVGGQGNSFMVPQSGSPAIDSGLSVGGLIPSIDLLKETRPKGTGVDRGAYEVSATKRSN